MEAYRFFERFDWRQDFVISHSRSLFGRFDNIFYAQEAAHGFPIIDFAEIIIDYQIMLTDMAQRCNYAFEATFQ